MMKRFFGLAFILILAACVSAWSQTQTCPTGYSSFTTIRDIYGFVHTTSCIAGDGSHVIWTDLNSPQIGFTLAALATPVNGVFTTATTGGTLAASTAYYYRVAATGAASTTTVPSTETSITTGGGTSTNTVTVNWGQVPGALGYVVYCRSTGAELGCATITGGTVTSWTDTGSVTPSGAMPTVNNTGILLLGPGAPYSPTSGNGGIWANATNGVSLQGNGSTNDFELFNSAGSAVAFVGHGVANLSLAATLLLGSGATYSPTSGNGGAWADTTNGAALQGNGSTYDVALFNSSGGRSAGVVHGGTTFMLSGALAFAVSKGQHINTQSAGSDISGLLTISSSTTGSISFTTAFTTTPNCIVTPQTTGSGLWYISAISTTGFTVTVATSGTYTFGYICMGNPN